MEIKYKLEMTEKEMNMILGALGELPAKLTMGLIGNIQSQCNKQVTETSQKQNEGK